jgi:hypothetical protein
LVVATAPVATAKKDKHLGVATAPLVALAPALQPADRGHGAGKGGGRGQGQGSAKAKGNGGGGRGANTGSSPKKTATQSPIAVPAAAAAAPAPTQAPAPAASSTPAATTTPATRPVAGTPRRVRSVRGGTGAGRTRTGGRTAAGSPAVAGFAATALAPAGIGAGAAGASTAARRAPADSTGRALARQSTDGSPVARTAERIVSVIPWPMWALIGVLAALSLLLGAHSWIGDRQRRRLRDDVGLLQSALLPVLPGVLGAVATSAAYRPADGPGAGGDFYDMFEFDDGRLGVVVGDLSGHGREVLPQTALVRYTLRAYLEAGLAPRAALATAAGVLDHQLEVPFATVALATYDPRERTLTYALAGHPPPIVLGPDGPVHAVTAAASPPLGGGLSTGMRQTAITLPGRATVCFHTDGLVEARRNGELFGAARLEQALAQLGAGASADVLLARVAEQSDHRPDDMAACVLGLPGVPLPAGPRVEELAVRRPELAGDRPKQFLLACGLRLDAVPGVLAAADAALDQADVAVLRVATVDGSLTVDVLPPEPDGLSALPPEPVDERTLS